MELADDIDMLLSARKEFLLGPWVESAKACWTTDAERDLYEWNAKTQITLWGVPGSVLNDYACKSWSGLVKDFYKKRYELSYQGRMHALESGQPFDYDGFVEECLAFEKAWTEGHDLYPVEPSGSEIDICFRLWSKYRRNMHGMQ